MSDDMWRRADRDRSRSDSSDDTGDDFDDFGEITFADDTRDDTSAGIPRPADPTPRLRPRDARRSADFSDDVSGGLEFADEGSAPIRFGPSDTGPLPHWTEPPTGDLPRIFEDDAPTGRTSETRRKDGSSARRAPRQPSGDDSDVDIWGSYSGAAPRPILDEPAPRRRRDVPTGEIPVRSSSGDGGRGMFDDSSGDFDDFGDLSFAGDEPDDASRPTPRPGGESSGGRPRIKLGEPAPGSGAERGSGPLRRPDFSSPSGVSTTPMPATRRERPSRGGFDDSGFDDSGFDDSGFTGFDDPSSGAGTRGGRPPVRGPRQDGGDARRDTGRGRSRPVIGEDTFGDDVPARPMPSGRGRPQGDPRGGRGPGVPSSRGPRDPRRTGPVGGTAGRDMPSAIAVGLMLAAAFIGALMWKPVAVLAIVVLVCGLASIEFFDKVTEKGYRPASVIGIMMAVSAPLAVYWAGDMALPLVMVFALIATGATFVGAPGINANPLPNMAITSLGMTWIGMTGAFGALLARMSTVVQPEQGTVLTHIGTDTLMMVAVGVVANDVGALLVGSAAGSTPLRPWISPNKTTEGLMGGTLATFLSMWIVGLQSTTWNDIAEIVILATAVAILAPLGDLVESMFKRNLEVKDFGSIIKGHGGVLDRFDGFLFVLPAAYYLLMVLEPYAT